MGWLVDFQKLYELIAMLAQNHWILNPGIVNYFKNLQLTNNQKLNNNTGTVKKRKCTGLHL